MKRKILFLSVALALVSGCALFNKPGVPATKISFNPKTEALNVSSPKDVTIGSVSIMQSNGVFAMTVTDYQSTNNAALVGVVVSAQAQVASNASATIYGLANLAAQAAGKVP